jgi:hypothetical protein
MTLLASARAASPKCYAILLLSMFDCLLETGVRNENRCSHLKAWLGRPDVRARFGVSNRIGNYTFCSLSVNAGLKLNQDTLRLCYLYVAELLERGIHVLIYAGALSSLSGRRSIFKFSL